MPNEPDNDYTEAELAEIHDLMLKRGPVVIAERLRVRREGSKRTIETDERVARTPKEIDGLMRWLPGGANHGGRPRELDARLADYRSAILAAAEKGYRPSDITASVVLRSLHRTGSEAQLRKDVSDPSIGGWKLFRAEVLASR